MGAWRDGPDLLANALEKIGHGTDVGKWAVVVGDLIECITLHPNRVEWNSRTGHPT